LADSLDRISYLVTAPKLGIHLIETPDNWLTPWHGTAVNVGGKFVLRKRYQAGNWIGLGSGLVLLARW
jgi:pyoverdine/dityrosine biosynthesis protein Dit1